MRYSIAEGFEHADLVAFKQRKLDAPHNRCELISFFSAQPKSPRSASP